MTTPSQQITDEQTLETLLGEPMEFVRAKVVPELSEAMRDFIAASPLVFISTIDAEGRVDLSPKGDPPGFITTQSPTQLTIPERPGNRLTFGFRNIIRNGQIGLMFLVPHQRETLRVKGTATLHHNPAELAEMAVNGKPALLTTHVTITECHFHCGKALIRSHLWKPENWPTDARSIAARSYAKQGLLGNNDIKHTEQVLDQVYKDELY